VLKKSRHFGPEELSLIDTKQLRRTFRRTATLTLALLIGVAGLMVSDFTITRQAARGRLTEAEHAFTRALTSFRELGDAKLAAFCMRALAKTHIRMGRLDEARTPLEAALDAHRAGCDGWAEAMVMRTLGELDLAAGRFEEAERWLTAALEVFRAQEAALFCARTLRDLAQLHRARGEEVAAKAASTEAIEIFRAYGAREYDELTTQNG